MSVEIKVEIEAGIPIDFNLFHYAPTTWHRSQIGIHFDPLWDISRELIFNGKCYFENCSEITPLRRFLASIDGIMNGYKILLEHPNESPNGAILSNFALKKILVIE